MALAVTFEVRQTMLVVPGDQVGALLESSTGHVPARLAGGKLGRGGDSGGPRPGPSNGLIEKRFALALLAAIDDVRRAAGLGPETVALQARLRELAGF